MSCGNLGCRCGLQGVAGVAAMQDEGKNKESCSQLGFRNDVCRQGSAIKRGDGAANGDYPVPAMLSLR